MFASEFDPDKAVFHSMFPTFQLAGDPLPLSQAGLQDSAEILVFERHGFRAGFDLIQMAYHHLAQGEWDGRPFLLTFCGVCNTAIGFVPTIEGKLHRFEPGGLYNGLIMLRDKETGSYWNHITGECMHGPLKGSVLDETFNIDLTTVAAEKKRSEPARIYLSKLSFRARLFAKLFHGRKKIGSRGFIPFFFYKTMQKLDPRLDKLEPGLGVLIDNAAKFYPLAAIRSGIEDRFQGVSLSIGIDPADKVPHAVDEQGKRPIQLFTRWYGFALTFPRCEIYRPD